MSDGDEIQVTSAFPPRDTAVGGYLEPIRAGGAVLWRPGVNGGTEVVLIRRPLRDDWTLPKGKLKNGEHPIIGAVREVQEETGLTPVLGRRLPPQYYLKDGWPKQVEWWAATPAEPGGFIDYKPNDEVDSVEWVPVEEARERLTYDHDVHVLDNFRAGRPRPSLSSCSGTCRRGRSGPGPTTTCCARWTRPGVPTRWPCLAC